MIDDTIETAKFGSALPTQQHVFNDPVSIAADAVLERHPQTERACKVCGAVKVTVHPPEGGGFRLWRRAKGWLQEPDDPGCTSIGT